MSPEEIIERIRNRSSLVFDAEFARRVAEMYRIESEFFFGVFSKPFLEDFAIWIAHEKSYRDLLGFYYEFISAPIVEESNGMGVPQFKCLRQYDFRRGAHLYTYVMVCTYRQVVRCYRKKKPGDIVVGRNASLEDEVTLLQRLKCKDWDDFLHSNNADIGWEILCSFFADEDESELSFEMRKKRMKKAFDWLQEKDKKVLKLTVLEGKTGLEVFERLKSYVKPTREGDDVDEWSDKKKQDTVSGWKTRAMKRLRIIYKDSNMNV